MLDIKVETSPAGAQKGTIHSGHFMVSRVHDVNNEDDDEEEIKSPFDDDSKGFDFLSANKETSKTYNFGGNVNFQPTVSIDASLTKLFECMSLAYSGKITSPRWKQFRGLHVSQKQRIRLNNLIWREWHLQYICQKPPKVCQFACPLSDDIHSKPEAVVLEGKYWKRRLDTVTAEYKKWRRYFKERIRNQQNINFFDSSRLNENELLEKVKDVTFIAHSSGNYYMSSTDLNLLQTDMMDMDFTNELFASLNQPFAFPNPRELSQLQLGCADLIQPGLIQLQPNLEEFMDIDTMQEFFQNSRLANNFNSAFVTENSSPIEAMQGNVNSNEMSLVDFLTTPTLNESSSSSNYTTPSLMGNSNNFNHINNNFLTESQQPITFQQTSDNTLYHLEPNAILVSPSYNLNTGQQTYTVYQNVSIGNASLQQKPVVSATISHDLLTQMLQQQQQRSPHEIAANRKLEQQRQPPPPPVSLQTILSQPPQHHRQQKLLAPIQPHNQSPTAMSPLLAQSLSTAQATPTRPAPQRKPNNFNRVNPSPFDQGSAGQVISGLAAKIANNTNSKKKDMQFAVPAKPLPATPRKNRVIAPAPTPIQSSAYQTPLQSSSVLTPIQSSVVLSPVQSSPVPLAIKPTPVQTPSMQASYLAELLRNGTYPGAFINIKKEPTQPLSLPSSQCPITTTTNHYQHVRSDINSQQMNVQAITPLSQTTPIQPALATIKSTSAAEHPSMLKSKLKDVLSSSSTKSMSTVSASAVKDMEVRFSLETETKEADSEPPVSPEDFLPDSPDSSLLMVKRSPSPCFPMDTTYASAMSPSMDDSPEHNRHSFPKNPRRVAHLSAEQKRRCNLKSGFDMLQILVPSLTQNPKVSKATMLQKTAEFCKSLKAERIQMQKEAAVLKKEIESLKSEITMAQSQLPETGVVVTTQRKTQMKEMFNEYVRDRTEKNWKFWIFSEIVNNMYDSYCNTVSTSSYDDLCRTTLTWLDQSCSLVNLRPSVLVSLTHLCTSTSMLTEPHKLKDQALQAVTSRTKVKNRYMHK